MTDEQLEALGRRWLAAGGDVRPGMVICDFEGALRVIATATPGRLYVAGKMALDTWTVEETDWIDLSDAPTRGGALEVIRERFLDGYAHLTFADGQWCLRVLPGSAMLRPFSHGRLLDFRAGSEEEVLVMALEAAPKVTP